MLKPQESNKLWLYGNQLVHGACQRAFANSLPFEIMKGWEGRREVCVCVCGGGGECLG